MMRSWRLPAAVLCALILGLTGGAARAGDTDALRDRVLHDWYRMILELVRHTPTYTPPVASRAFAYTAITAYEATAAAEPDTLATLAGQVAGLDPVPARDPAAKGRQVVHTKIVEQDEDDVGRPFGRGKRGLLRPLLPGHRTVGRDLLRGLPAHQRKREIGAELIGSCRQHRRPGSGAEQPLQPARHAPAPAFVQMLSCPSSPASRCLVIA